MSACTIVTAYFKLKISKASHDVYKGWMQNMLINSNPMVIFCDVESSSFIESVRRLVDPELIHTHIILTEITDFHSHKYGETFIEHFEMDTEKRVGHNIALYMIWAEKSHFLKRAIEIDPFQSDYFLWTDIGCFRRENIQFRDWPNPLRVAAMPKDKVLLLSVFPFTESELACATLEDLPSFQFQNRIGAPIFGGTKEVLLRWHDLYYEMLEHFIYIGRFIGKDQSIMNSVYLMNKDFCELVTWQPGCADPWFYLQEYLA
jgi:Bacterial protein of unknown function (HtrL_YibB)